jgi:hypothetical protein
MKFKDYLTEMPELSKKKEMKLLPGKKQFFISATNLKTGKRVEGYIQTNDMSNIHGVFGKHGWIINKHYET